MSNSRCCRYQRRHARAALFAAGAILSIHALSEHARSQLEPYPVEASMRFEAWNGNGWTRDVSVSPGARVEWRVVMNYTGPRTDLSAIGEVQYQPVMSGADNTGIVGSNRDSFGPFWEPFMYCPSCPVEPWPGIPPDGNSPGPQPAYGRVNLLRPSGVTTTTNVMTTFRHTAGSDGAPPGDWMRIAGSFVSQWPTYPLLTAPGADAINRIQRGVVSGQLSQSLLPMGDHVPGVVNVTVFRMATLLSDTNLDARTLTITSDIAFLKRAGGPTSTDDRRYMSFQTGNADSGSYRVGVAFQDLTIHVVPGPASMAVLGCAAWYSGRRRR